MNQEHALLTLFKAKRKEIGTAALAEALGVKNTSAIRMICTGSYPNPAHVLDKFARVYIDIVYCPFAERDMARPECTTRSTANRPASGKIGQDWWQACQTCTHRGTSDE